MSRLLTMLLMLSPIAFAAAQNSVAELDDLQVTATRVARPLTTVPASITVLSGDELRLRGMPLLIDALRLVPGVHGVQTGSYGAPASIFVRGGESDFTKVLVDGVTINSPGGGINLANLSLDNVERIEIVRGPASVLYGADAMSGVIHVITRDGKGPASAAVEASGGSLGNSEARAQGSFSARGFRATLAGSRLASDGIYEFNNRYLAGHGSGSMSWEPEQGSRLAVTARYSDVLGHFPTDGSGMPVDRNQRSIDRDLVVALQGNHVLSSAFALSLEAGVLRRDLESRDPRDSAADTTGFGFEGDRDSRTRRTRISARMDWRPMGGLLLMTDVGRDWESEAQESSTLSDFGFGLDAVNDSFAANRHTDHVGIVALTSLGTQVSLSGGLRMDYNSAFGEFLTWSTGANWQVAGGWRLWVGAASAFKAPTFGELFASSAYEIGNPQLAPEESRSLELGLERSTRHLTVALAVYGQEFTQLIQYLSGGPGEPSYGNLAAARARGAELSFRLDPSVKLTVRGHAAWLSSAVTDTGSAASDAFAQGRSLLRRPAWSAGLSGQWRTGLAALSLTANWIGERDDVDFRDFPATRIELPSYLVVDAAVDLPVVVSGARGTRMNLLLRAENIFDAEHYQAAGFRGRGRTLMAGGRLTF